MVRRVEDSVETQALKGVEMCVINWPGSYKFSILKRIPATLIAFKCFIFLCDESSNYSETGHTDSWIKHECIIISVTSCLHRSQDNNDVIAGWNNSTKKCKSDEACSLGVFHINHSDMKMINAIGRKDQVVGYPLKLSWDRRKLDGQFIFRPLAWIK